jgi:hypothetical protein
VSLQTRLAELIEAIGTDIKALQDAGGAATVRDDDVHLLDDIAIDAETDRDAALGKSFMLMGIETSHAARVRIYATEAQQTADQSREIGIDPEGNHGIILDFVSEGAETRVLSPAVMGASMETAPEATCSMWIQNLSGSVVDLEVTLTYLTLEA